MYNIPLNNKFRGHKLKNNCSNLNYLPIMSNLTKILIPSCSNNAKEVYFIGSVAYTSNTTTVYLTTFSAELESIVNRKSGETAHSIYAYCGNNAPNKKLIKFPNSIIINEGRNSVKQFVLNGQPRSTNNSIIIQYDYIKMRDSQTISDTTDYSILQLQNIILEENGLSQKSRIYKPSIEIPYWLASSMFLQHTCNYLNLVKWLIDTVRRDKKVSIKQGNLILAVLTDITLGYFLLQFVTQDTKYINFQLMDMLEKLINMLYSLLTWLMGAPVGLKLNNAFNKMLGKYFSYHVQLWWLFLDIALDAMLDQPPSLLPPPSHRGPKRPHTCSTKLDVILHVYRYIGYLGFTFQIAILSDMICLATFHSYCIYVYAARLFNIQISGLIALLRLFVGRKYNPLRGGIDSCEYTNQELFVGTVAFTILLLLLPTTAMYYIVFTLFRLLSLAVQHALAKLIYRVQTLPLYVGTLWLTKSCKVAGNILIEVEEQESSHLVLKMKLFSKSIFELIKNFKPPVEVPKQVEWTNLISNILKGNQIL